MEDTEPDETTFLGRSRIVGAILGVDDPNNVEDVMETMLARILYIDPETDEPYPVNDLAEHARQGVEILQNTLERIKDSDLSLESKIDMLNAWMALGQQMKTMLENRDVYVAKYAS